MAKYLNVDGNYKISVTDGGTITLDTGAATGSVIITGDLVVQGETTTVNTTTLTIEDRIITLNNGGSVGGEISPIGGQQVAGIEIDRGGTDVYWVFDENIQTESAGPGAWVGRAGSAGSSGTIIGIRTTSIDTAGTDLYLINQGTGVVTVAGTSDYEKQIFNYTPGGLVDFDAPSIIKAGKDDALINARGVVDYLDGFFVGKFQSRIESEDTFVAAHDSDAFPIAESAIEFTIDGNPAAFFFNNRTELQHIRIVDTRIETTSSNMDLVLAAPGAGSVKIDDTLLLTPVPHIDDDGTSGGAFPNQGYDPDINNPDAPAEGVKIYNKSEGPAGSGVYFVNSSETQDELVSKKKSILFSMIF